MTDNDELIDNLHQQVLRSQERITRLEVLVEFLLKNNSPPPSQAPVYNPGQQELPYTVYPITCGTQAFSLQ